MSKVIQKYLVGDSYPPEDHILRDLAIDVAIDEAGNADIHAPVTTHVCTQNGILYAGVLGTLVDVVGGILAVQAIAPDWLSTANITLMTTRDIKFGDVSGQGRIVRCGRTSVVVGVDLYSETDGSAGKPKPAGTAMITYSRLTSDQRALRIRDKNQSARFSLGLASLEQPLLEKIGIQILDSASGRLQIDMRTYVRNSLNSLQGGIIAFLGDLAGQMTTSTACGGSWQTRDLIIHYMTPGIKGPFATRTEVLRSDNQHALMRIEVLDRGDDDRLMAIIFNACDQLST